MANFLGTVPAFQRPNPNSPDFMEYQTEGFIRRIRLLGPGGTFSLEHNSWGSGFQELPCLPDPQNIREIRLMDYWTWKLSVNEFPLSALPALETVAPNPLGQAFFLLYDRIPRILPS